MQPTITPRPSARPARAIRHDHAAAPRAEPERPRGVRHAGRLADAARLGELDVDAVRDLPAGGDVGERVAVLVHVDRERRAAAELRPAWVALAERLLDVLDPERRELADCL